MPSSEERSLERPPSEVLRVEGTGSFEGLCRAVGRKIVGVVKVGIDALVLRY